MPAAQLQYVLFSSLKLQVILTSFDVQYNVTYTRMLQCVNHIYFLMRTWLRIFNSECSDLYNIYHHTTAMGTLIKFWSLSHMRKSLLKCPC